MYKLRVALVCSMAFAMGVLGACGGGGSSVSEDFGKVTAKEHDEAVRAKPCAKRRPGGGGSGSGSNRTNTTKPRSRTTKPRSTTTTTKACGPKTAKPEEWELKLTFDGHDFEDDDLSSNEYEQVSEGDCWDTERNKVVPASKCVPAKSDE